MIRREALNTDNFPGYSRESDGYCTKVLGGWLVWVALNDLSFPILK